MTVWQDSRLLRRRFWPKDVGHRRAILQPFDKEAIRDWSEVLLSSLLMLQIADMVRARARCGTFSAKAAIAELEAAISGG